MGFSSFIDFYERKSIIKHRYSLLSFENKIIYKYYIYSKRYIKEWICDAIWNYINECPVEEMCYDNILEREYYRCLSYERYLTEIK